VLECWGWIGHISEAPNQGVSKPPVEGIPTLTGFKAKPEDQPTWGFPKIVDPKLSFKFGNQRFSMDETMNISPDVPHSKPPHGRHGPISPPCAGRGSVKLVGLLSWDGKSM